MSASLERTTASPRAARAGRLPNGHGQAGVEFALVLLIFLPIVWVSVQLLGVAYARATLGNLADRTAIDAGASGGETGGVDARLLAACSSTHLDCMHLQVRITTSAPGRWHTVVGCSASAASLDSVGCDPSAWPAPAPQGMDLTVELAYDQPFTLPGIAHSIRMHVARPGTSTSARTPGPPQ